MVTVKILTTLVTQVNHEQNVVLTTGHNWDMWDCFAIMLKIALDWIISW